MENARITFMVANAVEQVELDSNSIPKFMLMKSFIATLLFAIATSFAFSQEFDADQFKSDIQTLYLSAKQGFKDLKQGEATELGDGLKHFESSLQLNGAKEVAITMDAEKSNTYIATYVFKNIRIPQEKVDEMVQLIVEATAEYGLAAGKGTDRKYVKYQKQTIEFPSDNIDVMGKYPSFVVGLVKDGNPMELEITISQTLWR